MKTFSHSILATLCCYSTLASAQQEAIKEIVVTAARSAQTVDETLASVTVIDRQDIERSQATTVAEVIQKTPGVSITNAGGLGKSTGVYLRGTAAKDLLVLIDGIRVGSATLGQVAFEELNLSQVERIEIVRGPRSSLYGSDAAGGVIQIFTRKGAKKFTPSLSVSAGSDQTRSANLNVRGGNETLWYSLGASAVSTDGFDAKIGDDDDKDGYKNQGAHFRVGSYLEGGHQVETFFSMTDSDNEYDGWTNQADALSKVLGVRGLVSLTDNWALNITAGRSWDKTKNSSNGVFSSAFNTQRDSISLQNDIHLGSNMLIAGVDLQRDKVESSNDYAEGSRLNKAIFAQYMLMAGSSDVEFSLRADDNEQFGTHTTGGVAWGIPINDRIRFAASYATAFKAPSFNDLYYPYGGNPDLVPEESDTFELSLKGEYAQVNWQAALYQTRFDNMIAWTPDAGGNWTPSNVNEARIRGLELEAGYQLNDWLFSGNVALLDPEVSSGINKGNRLQRRASQILNLNVDRQLEAFSFGATLHAENRRYTSDANTDHLGGFGTVDLRAAYRLTPEWLVKAKVANLLDKGYQTAKDYNQPGTEFLLTLAYQPR